MIKVLHNVGLERTYLNIIKSLYKKSTANNILHGKKNLGAISLKSGMSQHCLLSPLLLNIVLEALVGTIRQ